MFNTNLLDKEKLLKVLDPLGYFERMKKVALLGRENKDAAAYSRLLLALLEGGAYEANLALTGAEATGNVSVLLAALNHRTAGVRKRAAGLLAGRASIEVMEGELEKLSQECRRYFLNCLSLNCREEAAERLLPVVNARWGAKEAAVLLPACSGETVRQWLVGHGYAIGNWNKAAKRHPDVVADYLLNALENAPEREKKNVWWRFSSAVEALSRLRPGIVLACALEHGPMDILHPVLRKNLGFLIPFDAEAVHKLLTREEAQADLIIHGVPKGVLKKRRYFSIEQWKSLAVLLADQSFHLAQLLHCLAPSKRAEIFEEVYDADARIARVFPEQLLDELPHDLRGKEASRMLGLRELKEDRVLMLQTKARLSVVHAREMLEQAAVASNADERGTALALMVKCTALSRQGMGETLVFLKRIKNDQDLVRYAVFSELARCPASLYKEEHIPELEILVDSVVEARDTSYLTTAEAEKLAFGLMRQNALHPQEKLFTFALSILAKLVKQSGYLTLPPLSRLHLPQGMEEVLYDELYPFLAAAAKREDHRLVLQLAGWFGKRGYCLTKLQDMLQELTKAKSASTASQAARYWLANRKTRDARVSELLTRDKSFITVSEVFEHLHRKRQEWLDPYISGAVIKGKFLSGKTVSLLSASDGFHRWLPRQQRAFRSLLERVAIDGKRSLHERARAIQTMSCMPDAWPDPVVGLLDNGEVFIAEAALHALSLTEEPERALPLLLEHLDGDRARVSMYSVPRCMRRVSPVLLADLLEKLLRRDKLKITVRKEAVRLLGAYRTPNSMSLLLEELEKPHAHKDVIIAIGHAVRLLLDDERSWKILGVMAASPQRDILNSLLAQRPHELPLEYRARYLTLLLEAAFHTDLTVGRAAFQALGLWTDGHEETVAAASVKAIADLDDTLRWGSALNTLLEAARDGKVNDRVLELVRYLACVSFREEWNASSQRDVPHRQRLTKLIGQLTALPPGTRLTLIPLYQGMIDCLAAYETLQSLVVKLQMAAIDWRHSEAAADSLVLAAQGLSQQPHLLPDACRHLAHTLRSSKGYWRPEELLAIVDALDVAEGCEALALGLSVLQVAGGALGWNETCASRLRAYRVHPHPVVRTLALDIWTAAE
jgi:hypothetical protein